MLSHTEQFIEQQNMLYGIAYRMLGSFSDAEDIVQDAWLRWQKVPPAKVTSPKAYLASTVSRLCIDQQRRARFEQLTYPGPWLPEPVDEEITNILTNTEANVDQAQQISMGFVRMLRQLPPVERAVFILKEAFDLPHDQIAAVLDIRIAHSRQLLRRAKTKLTLEDGSDVQMDHVEDLFEQFLKAAETGDLDGLQALMTEDIIAYSDGGGKATAAIIPLVGKDRVCTVLMHLMGKLPGTVRMSFETINGAPALVMREDETIHSCHCVTTKNGRVHRLYSMRNPEKLGYLDERKNAERVAS